MFLLKKFFTKLFLIVVCLIIFLAAFIQVKISYKEVEKLNSWKLINAIIISSNIHSEYRSKGMSYCPKIEVKYFFNDELISSNLELEVASCRPFKYLVKKTLEEYTIGKDIQVFVNPQNNLEIRANDYSFGFIFYLMSFLSIITLYGLFYVIFTPYNKLDRTEIIDENNTSIK